MNDDDERKRVDDLKSELQSLKRRVDVGRSQVAIGNRRSQRLIKQARDRMAEVKLDLANLTGIPPDKW